YPLAARRDVGAGILPPRLGRANASPLLGSPLGLAWRLHRTMLIVWSAGFLLLGAVYGGAADAAASAVEESPEMQDIFARLGGGASFADAFITAIMSIMGLIASGYAIQAALRMRTEESSLRSEPVLGAAVNRLRWAGSHLVFALLGPAVAMVL